MNRRTIRLDAVILCLTLAFSICQAQTTVPGGTISTDTTWDLAGSPYEVTGQVIVEGTDGPDGITTLTIEPGVVVEFGQAYELVIGTSAPGALVADGDAAGGPATIRFTTSVTNPNGALWDGIWFRANAQPSILRNVAIEHSGRGIGFKGAVRVESPPASTITIENATFTRCGDSWGGALLLDDGTVEVIDSTFENNVSYDLRFFAGTATVTGSAFESVYYNNNASAVVTFDGNTLNNWGARASRLTPDGAGAILSGNSASPVPDAVTEIMRGTMALDGTWTPFLGDLRIIDNVTVEGSDGPDSVTTLRIEGGTRIQVNDYKSLTVGNFLPGALQADGDTGSSPGPIVFTSSDPAPTGSEYGGIFFRGQAAASTLRNVVVEYGGRTGNGGAVSIEEFGSTASFVFERLHVREIGNGNAGLFVGRGSITVQDSRFENETGYDIRLAGGSGAIANSTLSSVFQEEFGSADFTMSGNTLIDWGQITSTITPNMAATLATANTVTAVPGAETKIPFGVITVDGTFAPEAGTYHILYGLEIRGTDGPDGVTTLTLQPNSHTRIGIDGDIVVGSYSSGPGRLEAPGGLPRAVLDGSLPSVQPGSWGDIDVRPLGSVLLRDVDLIAADTALDVEGTLEASNLLIHRSVTGFDFRNATTPATFENIRCRSVTECVVSRDSTPVFRGSELVGVSGGARNDTPAAVVDAIDNWWGSPDGASGVGPGTGAAVTEGVLYDPWRDVPDDDLDGVPLDDGDGTSDPCTGGTAVDCDDNCPTVGNPSQADADADGIGDACDEARSLTVSTDPADGADFSVIQEAIETALDGTTIRVYPGVGPYEEDLRFDQGRSVRLVGVTTDPPVPVILDDRATTTLFIPLGSSAPHLVRNFTMRGDGRVIDAHVSTVIEDVVFDDPATGVGIGLEDGSFEVRRVRMEGVSTGMVVDRGAVVEVDRTEILGTIQGVLLQGGEIELRNTLIAGGTDGILINFGASDSVARLRFVTIADNTDIGIDNRPDAQVAVEDSIVHGNLGGDLANVTCDRLSNTNTGEVSCAGTRGNLSAGPLLDGNYRLGDSSPCIDIGDDPASYEGRPHDDVDGQARLADGDGDGSIRSDCGADEYIDPNPVIAEVGRVFWSDALTLEWELVAGAVEYHLYGDDVTSLGPTYVGACLDALDPDRTDTMASIGETPSQGEARFYLVTAEDASGNESIVGYGSSSQRSRPSPCP